jgi:hypothetical protein
VVRTLCVMTISTVVVVDILILRKQTSPRTAPVLHQPRPHFTTNQAAKNDLHLAAANRPRRVCCDHQLTDRCESPTRPRSSPLRLDPQASRLRLHPAHLHVRSSTRIASTLPYAHYSPPTRSAPRRQDGDPLSYLYRDVYQADDHF